MFVVRRGFKGIGFQILNLYTPSFLKLILPMGKLIEEEQACISNFFFYFTCFTKKISFSLSSILTKGA